VGGTLESNNWSRIFSTSLDPSSRAADAAERMCGAEVELEVRNWELKSDGVVPSGMRLNAFSIAERVGWSISADETKVSRC
jgi:hypothetical protein